MRTSKIQNGCQGLQWGLTQDVVRSPQLSLNKFLHLNNCSMRKCCEGEEKIKKEKNGENSGPLTLL